MSAEPEFRAKQDIRAEQKFQYVGGKPYPASSSAVEPDSRTEQQFRTVQEFRAIQEFRDQARWVYTQNPWLERLQPEKSLLTGRAYYPAKRVLDVLLMLASLPVWLPLMAVCALLVKLESPRNPILFIQNRYGKGGRRFRMYKFRTMVANAEALKEELAVLNELKWPDFKITNDPRITRVGRLLRKTSLDELPQVFNVLRGDMSLVGPRPTSFSPQTYELWQTERLDVIPGLTGLWQILGRGSTEFDERLRLDIAYIEKRCLWLDVQILARTLASVASGHGAH